MAAEVAVAQPDQFSSYFTHRAEDHDLGRPIVLHKPLQKGEHTQRSLAKIWDDDPGMRPKVMARAAVNKPDTGLSTSDIWGAQAKPTPHARGTNPNVPQYVLPSADDSGLGAPGMAPSRPGSARPAARDRSPSVVAAGVPSNPQSAAAAGMPSGGGGRDTIGVGDIEGTRPKAACRPQSARPLTTPLDVSDVEGSWPGWKPHFRAHVGVNLRDGALNVSDINNYRVPKSYRNLYQGQQAAATQPQPRPVAPAPQQHVSKHQQAAPSLPPGFAYTGLPLFQASPAEVEVAAPPPMDAGEVEAAQLGYQQAAGLAQANAELAAARAAGRAAHSAAPSHAARVSLAEGRDAARAAANDALSALRMSRAGVEAMWDACRLADRQGSGRVTVAELVRAFDAAGVQRSAPQMRALVSGLQDNTGLLPYRDLAKVLLLKSMQPGADPKLFAVRPARPASARPATGAAAGAAATSSSTPVKSRPVSARPVLGTPASVAPAAAAAPAPSPLGAGASAAPAAPAPAAPPAPPATAPTTAPAVSYARPEPAEAQGPAPSAVPGPSSQQIAASRTDMQATRQQQAAREPPGLTYHPYKAQAYWFSGVDAPEALQHDAAGWKASDDFAHTRTMYHVGQELVAAASPPAAEPSASAALAGSPSAYLAAPIRDAPTTSSLLKSGRMTAGELAESLRAKADAHRAAAAARPGSARAAAAQLLLATAGSGASLGNKLKGTAVPVGTGQLQFGVPKPRPASAGRPSGRPAAAWAGPAGTRADASFSSVAQCKGGPVIEKLHRQMLQSDIRDVRLLY